MLHCNNVTFFLILEIYSSPLGHVSIESIDQKNVITQSVSSNQGSSLHQHLDLKLENSQTTYSSFLFQFDLANGKTDQRLIYLSFEIVTIERNCAIKWMLFLLLCRIINSSCTITQQPYYLFLLTLLISASHAIVEQKMTSNNH